MTIAFVYANITVALIAVVLLIRGLRGRRVGDEPCCRKCGYELTGLQSAQCPECGVQIVWPQVPRGTRKRRPALIVVALLLIVTASAGLTLSMRNADWRDSFPTRILIAMAELGDSGSLRELNSRQTGGSLTAAQITELAGACLLKQEKAAKNKTTINPLWVDLLEAFDVGDQLTEAQAEEYHKNVAGHFEMEVRKPVRSGESLPIKIEAWELRPSAGLCFELHDYAFYIDGRWVNSRWEPELKKSKAAVFSQNAMPGGGFWTVTAALEPDLAPGTHRLVCKGRPRVRRGGEHIDLGKADTELSCPLIVQPRDATDIVELVAEPVDPEILQSSLRVLSSPHTQQERQSDGTMKTAWQYFLLLHVDRPLPVSVAYEVLLLTGGGDPQTIGTAWGAQGDRLLHSSFDLPFRTTQLGVADVILRPSAGVARQTVSLHRISSHELTLPSVDFDQGNPYSQYNPRMRNDNPRSEIGIKRSPVGTP